MRAHIKFICKLATLITYTVLLNGWVVTKLWSWFVVATFGLPALSIPVAIGGCLIASLIIQSSTTKLESFIESFSYVTFAPLIALLIGWIVTLFL